MKHITPIQTFQRDADKDFRPVIEKADKPAPAVAEEEEEPEAEKVVPKKATATKKQPAKS